MKLKYTYLFFLVISAFILLKSNSAGTHGATPTPLTSCASVGCHTNVPAVNGATTIDSIALFDRATGLSVSQYVAGKSYRIAIVGKYLGTANLYKFGYIVGNGGKGTYSGTSANSTTSITTGIGYWGHSAPKDSFLRIPAGPFNATIFIDTATWTAPATGSGTVTFTGLLNAVNVNAAVTGDKPIAANYTKNFTEFLANVNVAIGGGANFCAGTSKTFTATPANGGATPTYQWYLNGATVGTGGTTYTTTTLANNDSVWVVMTSSIAGVGNSPATSNKVKVTVNPSYANNSLAITCNKTSVCAGDTAIYTANAAGTVTGPTYRWYLNNTLVFTGNPYQKNGGFIAGDSVSCRLQVTNPCATPAQDTSNYIKLTVNASPTVTAIPNQNFCPGVLTTKVSFTSSMPSTIFTWTNNNPAIGLPASGVGDSIGRFTPINAGTTPINATITVYSYAAGCNGSPRTFTITISPVPKVRRPNVPTYCAGAAGNIALVTVPPAGATLNWTNTNTAVGIPASGTNTPINFTSTNTTNDSLVAFISAHATAGGCVGPDSTFRVVVYPVPVTTIVPNIIGCNGVMLPSDINFSSTVTGATFNWTNSNAAIGIPTGGTGNIAAFAPVNTGTAPIIANMTVRGRYINCNGPIRNFTFTVNNNAAPLVDIFSKDTLVCPGASSLFKATPTNGGSAPTYQWYYNGAAVTGAILDTFTFDNLANNDMIHCVMTSNSDCATTPTATSRSVTIKTLASVVPTIILTSVKDTICQGQAVTINSSVTGGGPVPTYQWYLNGSAISGATGNMYLSTSFIDNDIVTCEMTSSFGCADPPMVVSNAYKLRVFANVATQITLVADKNNICSDDIVTFTTTFKGGGMSPKVLWTLNGLEMNTNTKFIQIPINSSTDVVRVEVKSSEVCPSPSTMILTKSIDSVGQGPYVDVFPDKYIAFCQGDSAVVKAFNGAPNLAYQWSNGMTSDSFYSKVTNSFTLRVSQPGNKCPRYYGPLTTHMNALPFKPEISSTDGIIRSSFADHYQWQLNNLDIVSADTQTYKVAISGNYRVKVRNMAGCVNYSDPLLVYPLSIGNTNTSKMAIYPNPSTGNFYIKSEDKKIENVLIYDLNGKIVYSNSTKEMSKHIELDKLPKGNYLIEIKTNTDSYQEKIELR